MACAAIERAAKNAEFARLKRLDDGEFGRGKLFFRMSRAQFVLTKRLERASKFQREYQDCTAELRRRYL